MKKQLSKAIILVLILTAFMTVQAGCKFQGKKPGPDSSDNPPITSDGDKNVKNGEGQKDENMAEEPGKDGTQPGGTENEGKTNPDPEPIDLEKVKPNEAGKIMIVMFHKFVDAITPGKNDNDVYTTTFDEFEALLQTLYDKNYRLISMQDYLNNEIDVPAGFIPIVFTFDDGTSGQFSLVEENGQLVANKKSAVGIMEEFSRTHPDFGLEGTFYVNLAAGTFNGAGTVQQRLKYLIDKGFEIGNHTYNHIDLRPVTTAEKVMEEVGGNQKAIEEMIPGYRMESLALPLGHLTKEKTIREYITKGEYEGIAYENKGIMLVGAEPAPPSVNIGFDPLFIPRVRATGAKAEDYDLNWWLEKLSRESQYVSDGDPNTVTVPKAQEDKIDKEKLNGKTLRTY